MTIVSAADQKRVADAITSAERQTSGEIVAVIAGESASYFYVPFMWAALIALAVPFPLIFWTWWPVQYIYLLQLAVYLGLLLLLAQRSVRLALVPKSGFSARSGGFSGENLRRSRIETLTVAKSVRLASSLSRPIC